MIDFELEERAAIMEFSGGMSREAAEKAARVDRGLRPYQALAVAAVKQNIARGVKRNILYMPTGSGKTETAGEIIKMAVDKRKRVAFVCHRIELVKQASERFFNLGIPHGVIQGENSHSEWSSVVVASIQTVASRGIEDMDLIIVDEAHACAGSDSYKELFAKFSSIPIVGLSATPFSKGLGLMFDGLVIGATIRDLIDQGYLVDCEIYSPGEPDLTQVKIVAGDYQQDQLGEAVDKPELVGDIVTHWLKLARGQQTICFATNILHSKHICDEFEKHNIPAGHIDAYTPPDERKRIIEAFKAHRIRVLCNVSVLAEGFDVPAAACMILARPTKSLVRYIQMAGRVLRPYDGKEVALMLDHSGTAKRLGFPTDDLPLVLDDGKPRESVAQEAKEKLPKMCVKCSYMKPVGVHQCPKCGFLPERKSEIETADGELVKLERKKKKEMTTEQKADFYAELKTYAAEKGYKSGWAANKFKERTGVWPNHYKDVPAKYCSVNTRDWIKSRQIAFAKAKDNDQQR